MLADWRYPGDIRKADAHEPSFLRGLGVPLIETDTHWVIQSFSYPNYLRELGRNAQSALHTFDGGPGAPQRVPAGATLSHGCL